MSISSTQKENTTETQKSFPSITSESPEIACLFSNLVLFSQNVCRSLMDMGSFEFTITTETMRQKYTGCSEGITIYAPFYGKISGQFVASMDRNVASNFFETLENQPFIQGKSDIRYVTDFIKEVINIGAGHSLVELESHFGALTLVPPTVSNGSIEFPSLLSAQVQIKGQAGSVTCAFMLNLADLRLGKKLDEAQKKLHKVYESQNAMLVHPSDVPDARFSVYFQSLNEAGGDIYDVITISDGVHAYFVGDVSGHDIGAGFLTASIRALLRQNCTPHFAPLESMQNVNNTLCQLFTHFEYVTACYAILNRKEHILSIINMGHPPLLFLPLLGTPQLIAPPGDVLGVFRNSTFGHIDIPVKSGDRFFIYTDGLVEGDGTDIWGSGTDRLLQITDTLKHAPFDDMALLLCQRTLFETTKTPKDDVVVLGIEV